jgi:hypothetical protein
MSKRSLTILLAASLISPLLCVQSRGATRKEVEQTQFAQKVKLGIARMGVGEDAQVSVQLRDKTRVGGYISEINEDSFVVTNLETSANTTVAYPAVRKIQGQHITTGLKIALQVGGLALCILVLWAAIAVASE